MSIVASRLLFAMADSVEASRMEGFAIVFMLIMILVMTVLELVLLIDYILKAISLMNLADRWEVKNAWLSFLPVGTEWVLGALVDRMETSNGRKTKWGKTLLTLSAIFIGGFLLIYAAFFVLWLAMLFGMVAQPTFSEEAGVFLIIFFLVMYLSIAVLSLLSVAVMALNQVCLYKVYEILMPEKAISYLLLSLLVPFGRASCLMKCNKSDCGGPPTPTPVTEAPAAAATPIPAAPAEPVTEETAFGCDASSINQNASNDM